MSGGRLLIPEDGCSNCKRTSEGNFRFSGTPVPQTVSSAYQKLQRPGQLKYWLKSVLGAGCQFESAIHPAYMATGEYPRVHLTIFYFALCKSTRYYYYYYFLNPRYQCSRGRFEKISKNEKAGYV